MKKDLTIKEVASMGGQARWKNVSAEERSKQMKAVRRREKLSTVKVDTQARGV